jgi:hypothetical protein
VANGLVAALMRADCVGKHRQVASSVTDIRADDGGGLGKGGTVSGNDSHDHLIDPAQFLHFVIGSELWRPVEWDGRAGSRDRRAGERTRPGEVLIGSP